ncbi:DNA-binding transcriptional regulator, LysR family [Cohaesibacter marisflavi]|uniref:DNA-binding transcriptional regulator, LysR family n=1 Tax=Cohaesibacter marisflavi TaxID=655353 RepID=A0A1I5CSR3_9HYPH|nr:LysR family transcriptional regulator [Cohaesibacter marisflavi]SFN89974.1 DNA-binding transcriptional regulator, LysR family [Cohaesibacter marisflavi]
MINTTDPFAGVREFVEAVRSGSFTGAGMQLGLTGSAVGKSVSRLEARLGTKLLHRTTRRLSLTPEGQRYFDGWAEILSDVRSLEDSVVAQSGRISGRLNIHLPAAFGRRHVLPVLTRLAGEHRSLDLSVNFTERRVNLINDGVDLVVRIGSLADDADLVARRLGRQRLVICASPDYITQFGEPETPADLIEHDGIIGSRREDSPAAWLLRQPDGTSTPHLIRVRHEFSDGDAMLEATLAGAGLSQLPTWLVTGALATGALVPVLESFAGAEMPIHAVWPRSRYLKPAQRALIDTLVKDATRPDSAYWL